MSKFGSSFMMKSPLHEHGEKLRQEAKKMSSNVEQGGYDYENPEVLKKLEAAKKADKSHKSESPANANSPLHAPVHSSRSPSVDDYYGGEIDIPDVADVGKVVGKAITPVDKEVKGDLKDLAKKKLTGGQ